MSVKNANDAPRLTVPELGRARKASRDSAPLVCLTAYHAHIARLFDPHVDILLVGDSLGMVLYGLENTLDVSVNMMIAHGAAVVRGSRRALVVIDMPFGSYEASPAQAFRNAARVLRKTGAQAVKIEGGQRMAETISYLHQRGIPVMAHIGLTPQSVHVMGGFKMQGREQAEWNVLQADAEAVAQAGAFSVVLEGIPAELAETITKQIDIPTIGIGASPECDGQVLVGDDMLGLSPSAPKFVRQFARLGEDITKATQSYAAAVRERNFPSGEHIYSQKKKTD